MKRASILDSAGFAKIFGTTPEDVEETCGDVLSKYDFRYDVLEQHEFKNTLLEVIKTIDSDVLSVSGKARHKDWENGWNENLKSFVENNYDVSALVPRYMYKFGVRRLFSDYIRPYDASFEVNFYTIYRHYLFKKYFGRYSHVYEFGCGTGYNLVIMAQLFPDMGLTGLDWASNSVKLVEEISSAYHFNLSGRRFDYFNPDSGLTIENNSIFITLNSMEQLGGNYEAFLDFILHKKPSLCINSEPFLELYDKNNLLDYLSIKYHRKRNYLRGYLDSLKKLEHNNKIEILKVQKVPSGNLFHLGYSFVIWRVL